MTTITERLREVAAKTRSWGRAFDWSTRADETDAIAAELDAAPAGDACMPVVAQVSSALLHRDGRDVPDLFWRASAADFVIGDNLIRQRDAMAAIASESERSSKLREEFARLQEVRTSVIASRDERIKSLEADLVERDNRIAHMHAEWGDDAAMLSAQARHAEDCLEAAKSRVAELEERERLSAITKANAQEAVALLSARIDEMQAQRFHAVFDRPSGEV